MCGIVGYIGEQSVADILLDGLKQLEYRGYDSSGVALMNDEGIDIHKAEGKLQNLADILFLNREKIVKPTLGIGHIRWATHGAPTVTNAHPHTCNCGGLAIVHNGIIENFKELRERLSLEGCNFRSQTDTETVAHLIAKKYSLCKNLTEAVRLATKEIEGAFALCVLHKSNPDKMVITKRNAPLLVGVGEGEYFVASDVPAIIKHTKKAVYLKIDSFF
jgi:glucosamine--fructose-6-phosphate aminotransferase (isomerizing)